MKNLITVMSQLPHAHGGPPLTGQLRVTPEDFRVVEMANHAADGEGEHVLLDVEKRGANTDWVARELARFAGVKPLAVGYAGLKDRHAVTRQFFSVQLAGHPEPDWADFPHAEVRILSSARHKRKLKRGALAGNRFELTVRDVQGDHERAGRVLEAIAARGVPNYFGEQRFGHGGANVERALTMFAGRRVDRATRSMLISAARSQIFNEVLAERVQRGTWDAAMEGDIWSLDGSRSWFGPEPITDALRQRLAGGDVHPSGPMWGRGELPTQADARALEQSVAAAHAKLIEGLERQGLEQDRRSLRLMPAEMHWQWHDEATLVLSFQLRPGAYATVLVRELVRVPQAASMG